MTRDELVQDVIDSFLPITLAVPESVVLKNVCEAIRWFNEEGVDIRYKEFPIAGNYYVLLTDEVDTVLTVYPSKVVTELFTAQTLLLGVTVLDYDLETIALKVGHLSTLRTFLASHFSWRYVKPYLYIRGLTTGVDSYVVEYLMHYDEDDDELDITGTPLQFIRRYALSRTKISEGRVLRMGSIIEAPMDGAELSTEGANELAEIKKELRDIRSVLPPLRSA